jgi:RimJ/RimL family protein N-acetyltransferase
VWRYVSRFFLQASIRLASLRHLFGGGRLVGYWIGKEHWGKGVATECPLHAHVAKHNVGSIRVLEKCGFSLEREESVEVAGKDVAELVLLLR